LEKVESDTLGEKGPRSHRSHRKPSKFYFVSIGAKLFLPQKRATSSIGKIPQAGHSVSIVSTE